MADDYQFDDLDMSAPAPAAPSAPATSMGSGMSSGQSDHGYSNHQGGGSYASELFSKQIKAKFRTFYVDLKESNNGKFVKISEKSHGRKSTIMMDAEDVAMFIEALQEVQSKL